MKKACVLWMGVLGCLASASAQLVISEVCAATAAKDPSGFESDWVEIHNSTASSVSLSGWSLRSKKISQADSKIVRYDFPVTNIVANGYLVIYCNKDDYPDAVATPGKPMIAPFNISKAGGADAPVIWLYKNTAIIDRVQLPDAAMSDDVSFGLASSGYQPVDVITPATGYSVFAPTSDLGLSWVSNAFQASSWQTARGSLGAAGSAELEPAGLTCRVDFNVADDASFAVSSGDANGVTRYGALASFPFSIPASAGLGMDSPVVTMTFWVRLPYKNIGAGIGAGRVIMDCRPSKTLSRQGNIIYVNQLGQLTCQPRSAANGIDTLACPGRIDDNAWHHVAVVQEQRGNGAFQVYIDGALALERDVVVDWSFQSAIPVCLGGAYDSTSWEAFNGLIDDFRIYNRSLAAGEVNLIMGDTLSNRQMVAYTFEEIGTDTGTAGDTHTAASAAYVTAVPAHAGRAAVASFAANPNQKLIIPASTSTDFSGGELTVAFWMNSSGTLGAGSEAAMLFDARANGSGFVITQSDAGKIFVQPAAGAGLASVKSISDGAWRHIAVSVQASTRNVTIAIDGAIDSSATLAALTVPGNIDYCIASSRDAYWRRYSGFLDDFCIYSGLLSPSELTRLYNSQTAGAKLLLPGESIEADTVLPLDPSQNSLYGRIPFTVATLSTATYAQASIAYEDGLIIWFNGAELFRANMPYYAGWSASAAAAHDPSQTSSFLIPADLLRQGENILAFHLARESAVSSPLFFNLGLSVMQPSAGGSLYSLMPAMTPGAENNTAGATPVGTTVAQAGHTPAVPAPGESVKVSIVSKALNAQTPVSAARLIHRSDFDAEVNLPMTKTGENGLLATWEATIPAAALPPAGHMLRYRVLLTDSTGTQWRDPAFNDPFNSPEYHGTIVRSGVASKLPLYHIFASDANLSLMDKQYDAVVTETSGLGARCSIFHDGEFYDNIRIDLRGNTTASFRKKSHGLRFNKGLGLRHTAAGDRVRKSSFVAEYSDPSFIRQSIAFWFLNQAGVPAPFHYPVQLQLNGDFYQLAFHSSRMTDELIEGFGWDVGGELYKSVGRLESTSSTAGFEKKLPENALADHTRYTAFINAIAPANGARERNAYDMMELPVWVNYLAATRITQECDDVWANLCLYGDTHGLGTWRPVPYDMHLSFGQWYYSDDSARGRIGELAAADDFKSHPLYGGYGVLAHRTGGGAINGGNRGFDVIYANPAFRQMYLRRLRTLMDQYLKEPGTPIGQTPFGSAIAAFTNAMDVAAARDRAKWDHGTGTAIYVWPSTYSLSQGVGLLVDNYLEPRRRHFYITHSITNTAKTLGYGTAFNAGIPQSQPAGLSLAFGAIETSPAGGDQEEEYIEIINPNAIALDISNWVLSGDVDHTFTPGTVIPAGGTLYLTPNRRAFLARAAAPKGGQSLFVQGNYSGKLGSRPSALAITDTAGFIAAETLLPDHQSDPQRYLRVTELMYAPPDAAGADAEYIELANISTNGVSINLTGVTFAKGIDYTFPAGRTLAPGATFLLAKSAALVPGADGVFGGGSLSNSGEDLRIVDAAGEKIQDIYYDPAWYPSTLKLGASLIARDPWIWPVNQYDKKSAWYPSGNGGAIGIIPKPAARTSGTVVITELLAHTDPPQADSVELCNIGAAPVDIGGWYLSDNPDTPQKYRIPLNRVLQPGAYAVFTEAHFGSLFNFSANGESAVLTAADASGFLTGYQDSFDFGATPNGISIGRYLNSQGQIAYPLMKSLTLGFANSAPLVGPIVISAVDSGPHPYVELTNIGGAPVSTGRGNPEKPSLGLFPCMLSGMVSFTFATNQTLAAGERILAVSFDPADAEALHAFRTAHDVANATRIVGPWSGTLAASGTLSFTFPDRANEAELPDHPFPWAPQVLSDQVAFKDKAPWPTGELPLVRIDTAAFANDPLNWRRAHYAPGQPGFYQPEITADPVSRPGNSISLNLKAAVASSSIVNSAESFGLHPVPGINWNELYVTGTSLSTSSVLDSTGALVGGASIAVSGTRGFYQTTGNAVSLPSARLFQGYIDDNSSYPRPTVAFSGIPYRAYTVYVYCSTDTAGAAFGPVTIDGIAYRGDGSATVQGTAAWGNAGSAKAALTCQEGVNVLKVEHLTAPALTVSGLRSGSARGCIAAVQIVAEAGDTVFSRTLSGSWHQANAWQVGEKTASWTNATAAVATRATVSAPALTVDKPVSTCNLTVKGDSPFTLSGTSAVTFLDGDIDLDFSSHTAPALLSAPLSATDHAFVIKGSDALTLSGANTFSHGVFVIGPGGVTADSALGASALTLAGYAQLIGAASPAAISRAVALQSGGGVFRTRGSPLAFTGAVSGEGQRLLLAGAAPIRFSGTLVVGDLFLDDNADATFLNGSSATLTGLLRGGANTALTIGSAFTLNPADTAMSFNAASILAPFIDSNASLTVASGGSLTVLGKPLVLGWHGRAALEVARGGTLDAAGLLGMEEGVSHLTVSGTLRLGESGLTIAAGSVTLEEGATLAAAASWATLNPIALAGAVTVSPGAGRQIALRGATSGSGSLRVADGTLSLPALCGHTGNTAIAAALQLDSGSAAFAGNVIFEPGATLRIPLPSDLPVPQIVLSTEGSLTLGPINIVGLDGTTLASKGWIHRVLNGNTLIIRAPSAACLPPALCDCAETGDYECWAEANAARFGTLNFASVPAADFKTAHLVNEKPLPGIAPSLTISAFAPSPESVSFDLKLLIGQLPKNGPVNGRLALYGYPSLTAPPETLSFDLAEGNPAFSNGRLQIPAVFINAHRFFRIAIEL